MSASILDELDRLLKGETSDQPQTTSKQLDPAGVKAWLSEEVKVAKGEATEIAKARAKHAKEQLAAALKAFKGGAETFEVSVFDAAKHREAQTVITDLEELAAKLGKTEADNTSATEENASTGATADKPKPDDEQAGDDAAEPKPDVTPTGDDVEKGWEVASDEQPWTSDMRHMKLDNQGRILHRKSISFG